MYYFFWVFYMFGSIVVSIPACHAGDRGSIPRRGEHIFASLTSLDLFKKEQPVVLNVVGYSMIKVHKRVTLSSHTFWHSVFKVVLWFLQQYIQ